MIQFEYNFGTPVVQCSPLAQVIISNQKGTLCDFCLQKIVDNAIKCSECKNNYYCNHICQENDSFQHQIECRFRLFEKIKKRLSMAMSNSESYSQNNQFNLNDYFDLNDMVDYTLLFFRILKLSKNFSKKRNNEMMNNLEEYGIFNYEFGNKKHQIDWKNLSASINIRSTPKRFKNPENDLSIYLSRFDSLNEQEINELDQLLGIELPNDDHFRNTIIENNVKFTLKNIIEYIVDEITNDYIECGYSLVRDEIAANLRISKDQMNENQNNKKELNDQDLFHLFVDDLKKKKFWEKLANYNLPYDQLANYLSSHMLALLRKSQKISSVLTNSQKSSDNNTNVNEELEEAFFYGSHPNELNYFSNHLNFDSSIIDKDEEECIKLMKTNYRLICLETLHKRSSTHDTELDCYFGLWLNEILKLLVDTNLSEYYGLPDYSEIEKVFFITIRYSIAITDKLCIVPIARAVYLPLTQMEHSCLPNTSVVFEGNNLKIYYLPKKKLQPNLSKKLNLNLYEIKVDFNYEISTKEESINIYILNKLRFLNCKCDRCRQTKKQLHSQINQIFDQFNENPQENEELFSHVPDNEFLNEYDFKFSQYQMDEQNESMTSDLANIDYDYCFGRLSKANLHYGNRLNLEYSSRIQDLLADMIDSFRHIFGYYHKQTTIMLLLINFCNLTIIKSCKDQVEMFFRFNYLHRYILELIDALVITNGSTNSWISKIDSLHCICHHLLLKLFKYYETEINSIQKKLGQKPYNLDQFLFDKCCYLPDLSSDDFEIIKNLKMKNSKFHDDYCYNPYESNDCDFESMNENSNLSDLTEVPENLEKMFNILNEISDFFLYRFL